MQQVLWDNLWAFPFYKQQSTHIKPGQSSHVSLSAFLPPLLKTLNIKRKERKGNFLGSKHLFSITKAAKKDISKEVCGSKACSLCPSEPKAARFRLRSETVPAQPSYDLLHRIPPCLLIIHHGKKDPSFQGQSNVSLIASCSVPFLIYNTRRRNGDIVAPEHG